MSLSGQFGRALQPDEAVNDLLAALWTPVYDQRHTTESSRLDAFLNYYAIQCYLASVDETSHQEWTHQNVVHVFQQIKEGKPREKILSQLEASAICPVKGHEKECLVSLIDLAARLLTMVVIGELRSRFVGRDAIRWESGSLKDTIEKHFTAQRVVLRTNRSDGGGFPKEFNAMNLQRMAGIKIEWTSNLAEHLLLFDDDKRVAIFHHAGFLKLQEKLTNPSLPLDLVKETLSTLALLFPQSDKKIRQWYKKTKVKGELPQILDGEAIKCGRLKVIDRQIKNFDFWHDRLVILVEAFEDAEPRGMTQWWYDRRRHVQWYTFWVAVTVLGLTVFFDLVQSIEGALQVYKAYHPS